MYTGQWCLKYSTLQSRYPGTSHNSPNHHQLSHHIFLKLTDSLKSLPSKVILILGKARSLRAPNLGCSGAESPGSLDVSPKISTRDVMPEQAFCHCEAANQSPVSVEEYSSFIQNLMQIHCSTCSVILNVTATQYTCSLNGVYRPHWLVQWSCHCSHKHIPVLSPWLPSYIGVVQTIVVILTMVGLFPGRPHIL